MWLRPLHPTIQSWDGSTDRRALIPLALFRPVALKERITLALKKGALEKPLPCTCIGHYGRFP